MTYWVCSDCSVIEETSEYVPAIHHRHYVQAFGRDGYYLRPDQYYFTALMALRTLKEAMAYRKKYERKKAKKS